ncbi:sigma 54-interacting transcriptional regulator [Coraliomargarita sp. SDUM461004]|uniref:Sigma 54-interacting transcriptional regulator n=1 Tax=Thalassobacterium sedimentorum TaxID=3041258 RepID=A0ABU1AG87_9BACT|nr:sigma 54-interacting transcriptional regulator [Coraliomargarita sp. SDUM461004]MDQ8193739.1 sigma 54-interacting transcriptional regulator [Coraliomargarita sp. SDUM461004]
MSLTTKCRGKDCDLAVDGPSFEMLDRSFGVHCRSVQELSLLFAVSQTLDKSFDLSEIVKPLLRRLRDMMGMERGMIAILNRDDGQILLSDAIGVPRTVPASQYFELIHPLLQRTVDKAAPVVTPNFREWIAEDAERPKLSDGLQIDAGTGLISVPLKFGEKVIGTLSVERPRNSRQGWEADLRLLTMIASVIAQAARLRQDAAEQIQSLRRENTRLQEAMAQDFRPKNMIGTADSMRTVYYHIEQVAQSTTTVLIRGESGTGKELVAKALHEKSDRKHKSFVKVNCAALPDSIIESELFGHEKGAFTGALSMRKGRFELANGGTIFLDEIGDISAATQVKLLRVLQEREFERVGSQETMQVDVRVIAATSRNLEEMIADGSFREDLYYRLNVFPIYMPALRDRKCDVMLLADYFIEKYAKRQGVKAMRISSAAIDLLVSYHWPGNVREIENCMERAVLLAKGQSIKAHHLPPTLQKKSAKETREICTLEDAMVALEREMIIDALKDTGSNMAEAARRLGLTERKMGLRVKKYDIELSRYK